MAQPVICPTCLQPIPADAPSGMCPSCLMGFARGHATQAASPTDPPPKPHQLQPLFPQLEIVELIGQGGMGVVYRARHAGLNRWVALKIFRDAKDATLIERFQREAQALARLSHPNIVAVYDYGRVPGYHYLVMEYVDGPNLRQLVASRSLTPSESLELAPQLCDALQYAHDQGIVHRDIKPENVLLDAQGRLKIADFGLAKLVQGESAKAGLTQTHQVMGTWSYMAPEQIEHPLDVDHRADIYSLGVVLYELLTGELPVGRFAPPSRKVQLDVRLDEVVLRALEKEPGLRYQHASDFKTDVEAVRASWNQPPSKAPPPPKATIAKSSAQTALTLVAIAAGVLGGLAFAAGSGSMKVIDRSTSMNLGLPLVLMCGGLFACAGAVNNYTQARREAGDEHQRATALLLLIGRLAALAVIFLAVWAFAAGSPQHLNVLDRQWANLLGIAGCLLGAVLFVATGWLQSAAQRGQIPKLGGDALLRGGLMAAGLLVGAVGVLFFVAGGLSVMPRNLANFAGIASMMAAGMLHMLAHYKEF